MPPCKRKRITHVTCRFLRRCGCVLVLRPRPARALIPQGLVRSGQLGRSLVLDIGVTFMWEDSNRENLLVHQGHAPPLVLPTEQLWLITTLRPILADLAACCAFQLKCIVRDPAASQRALGVGRLLPVPKAVAAEVNRWTPEWLRTDSNLIDLKTLRLILMSVRV